MGQSVLYLQTKSLSNFLSPALLHSLLTLLLSLYLLCSSFFLPFMLSSCSFLIFILCVCLRNPSSYIYSLLPPILFPYPSCTGKCYTLQNDVRLRPATDKRFSNFISQCPVCNFDKNIQSSSRHSDSRGNVRVTYQRGAFS